MTRAELANMMYKDLSPTVPRLAIALNRALLDIGEGSTLVGLGPGTHENDHVSFQERESVCIENKDTADILTLVTSVLWKLEENSSWKVIVDRKISENRKEMDLLYTIFRMKN